MLVSTSGTAKKNKNKTKKQACDHSNNTRQQIIEAATYQLQQDWALVATCTVI